MPKARSPLPPLSTSTAPSPGSTGEGVGGEGTRGEGLGTLWPVRSHAAVIAPILWLTITSTTPTTPTCTALPRTEANLTALLANPNIATPAATTAGQTLPEGTPSTASDKAAIEAIVHQWLACQNAGEPLRAWSLFSDGYLYRLLSRQGGLTEAAYEGLATPSPTSSEPAVILKIEEERELPDGRLGASVVISYPSVPMPKTFFFYFTQVDSRLMIDGILGEISFSVP